MASLSKSELMRGVLPYLAIKDAADAISFYKVAFGAEMIGEPYADEQGKIMNASLAINDGTIMLMDNNEAYGIASAKGDRSMTLQLVVDDGTAWWNRALEAGCEVSQEYKLEFWGDYYGRIRDPFGLEWAILEPGEEHRAQAAE
ncbi:VOC family protein [Pseudoruegeria sp. HB172150]|uniref:VOC family protein n=1 Tax=Pseudoruegeria sp. HB172150 TaxID=2721164 RepID=UPI001556A403|nr:VOC family protein [Pseudoruegeria sp. HB172150]